MPKRPPLLSAVCVLGALASGYALVLLISPALWVVVPSTAQRATGAVAAAVFLVSLYGLWRMRRWGLVLLAAALLARVMYALVAGMPWSWGAAAGPVAVLAVGFVYVGRLS